MSSRRFADFQGRTFFSVANLLVGALTVMAVFRGLPVRHWLADGSSILAAAGFVIGTLGLWIPGARGRTLARVGFGIVTALGLLTILGIATGLGALEGIHGALAAGSRLILVLVGAMVIPYLLILPGVEVSWLKAQGEEAELTAARAASSRPVVTETETEEVG